MSAPDSASPISDLWYVPKLTAVESVMRNPKVARGLGMDLRKHLDILHLKLQVFTFVTFFTFVTVWRPSNVKAVINVRVFTNVKRITMIICDITFRVRSQSNIRQM